jgi:PAS domain S-box-containing protein
MSDPRPASPHGPQMATRQRYESAWARYALAVAVVAAAALLTAALRLTTSAQNARIIFPFFYVAVFVAVWYGGRGPGLLTIALSLLVANAFFVSGALLAPDFSGLMPSVFFVGISLVAVMLIERSRRAEAEARVSRESLETTLKSIGDAVISTDDAGRVVFMNPVAERLTGWPLAEARGRALAGIFHIVNEETRLEVESPVEKVLREGRVVGLANHTILVARGGAEIPIDDSGAPIRDEQGHVNGVVLVFHDIGERRKTEGERALLAAIVESSADAIIGKTLEGIITSWNAAAERMYGYAAEEALGRHISLVVPPELSGELQEIMSSLSRGERIERLETVRLRKDGGRLDVAVTISPIRGSSGKWVGASTIARDITEQKRAADEITRLYKRAQEVNRAKDEFLATLSHELRTPLTPVLGWTNMIRSGLLGESETAHGISVIEKNSQALSRLINDLLDMSSILSGKMRIERAPVELASVVREAVETVRPLADARRIALEVQTGGLSPVVIIGDRTRLVQVFWNLLNNATKFSREGGRIVIRFAAENGAARVEVADEGDGIAPEFLPHVFERFRQADMGTTRTHGGLGIGLALVKSFVEAHGGEVEASSGGESLGSLFTVTLPTSQSANAPSNGDEDEQARQRETETCRVLLVEDSRDTLEMLRLAFEARGYKTSACASAEEALSIAEAGQFDIIVSDIGLPRIDGYELIGRLRLMPHLRQVPAIALTGYAGKSDVEAALGAGFDAHIAKPVDPSALAEQIAQLVKRAASEASER